MDIALVIEGGAMRGIHSVAVMDMFLENKIMFPHITAVSAGALNGMSYVSGQHGRSKKIITEYVGDKRYYCFNNVFRKKSIYGFDFMFGELSKNLVFFDFDAYKNANTKFYITTTEIESGKTVFFEKNDVDDISKPASASSSLPFFSPPVEIDGKLYYDGGVSNAVPYEKPFEDGYEKAVLLLTRHKGYRKPPVSALVKKIYYRKFSDKPKLLQKLMTVPERYNAKMDEIDKMEEEGRIFVIRPSEPVNISRLEKNVAKLNDLYQKGTADAHASFYGLQKFLGL